MNSKNSNIPNNKLQIKKFNASVLSDKIASDSSPVICIIGKCNTGKNTRTLKSGVGT